MDYGCQELGVEAETKKTMQSLSREYHGSIINLECEEEIWGTYDNLALAPRKNDCSIGTWTRSYFSWPQTPMDFECIQNFSVFTCLFISDGIKELSFTCHQITYPVI